MRVKPGVPQLEIIATGPTTGLRVEHTRPGRFTFGWHYHPEIELTHIVAGSGIRLVGDSVETFDAGDLVLLGGGVPHTWQSHAADRAAESVYAQFPPGLLGEAAGAGAAGAGAGGWATSPELAGLRRLIERADRGLRVEPGPAHAAAAARLRAAADARPGSAGRLIGLLAALDALAAAPAALRPLSAKPLAARPAGPAQRAIHRVLERLRRSLETGDPFTQADAAALAGRSPAAFSRFFHRQVGRTFVRYVNEWRVGLACHALVHTDRDVTVIAFDCGFGNLSNFNRRFRQIKGTTPRAFRQRRGL